jgi:hypothetical protein
LNRRSPAVELPYGTPLKLRTLPTAPRSLPLATSTIGSMLARAKRGNEAATPAKAALCSRARRVTRDSCDCRAFVSLSMTIPLKKAGES